MAFSTQAEAYVVLIDQQILFRSHAGAPGKHLLSVPRAYAAITEPKSGLLLKFQLHVHGWTEALALTVPSLPPGLRKRGVALTQLLPRVVLAPAG
ncbi:hypothetical protein [Amycolatopsis sp. NPDC051371]|uniref:hypothetical protein n=1 Tax=Amycolatopsis sp. NPDC051371 TaxID=3155800 RepID=UPI0034310D38